MLDFIQSLKHFVHVEYDTQTRQIREMWRQPLNARVAEGEAIANVETVQVNWNGALLCCHDNL